MFYNVMFHAINNIIPVLGALWDAVFDAADGKSTWNEWKWNVELCNGYSNQPGFSAFTGIYGNLYDRWRRGTGNFVSGQSRVTSWTGRLSKRIISQKKNVKQQFIWLALALALAVTGSMMIVAGTIQGLHF